MFGSILFFIWVGFDPSKESAPVGKQKKKAVCLSCQKGNNTPTCEESSHRAPDGVLKVQCAQQEGEGEEVVPGSVWGTQITC